MSRKPLVYIAGPYTDPSPLWNTHSALTVANQLLDTRRVTPVVPHLTHYWDELHPHPYDDWLTYDRELLFVCNAVLRLPGPSAGADSELRYAKNLGLPIFGTNLMPIDEALIELFDWVPTWRDRLGIGG